VLKEGAQHIKLSDSARRYLYQYTTLIQFAKNLDCENPVSIDILALAVYAWMPTILKKFETGSLLEMNGVSVFELRDTHPEVGLKVLNAYTQAIAPINNSWVGTSKFLHFLNPSVFPIWDSKICWTIYGHDRPNNYKLYREYFELLHAFTKQACSESLINLRNLANLEDSDLTDVRIIEMCLFAFGDKYKPKKNKRP
jgi:hypothetical protein